MLRPNRFHCLLPTRPGYAPTSYGSYRVVARIETCVRHQFDDPSPQGRGLTISVVVLVLRMVRMPGTDGGSDDDGIFVRGHGVLYVGWNEQEASDGIRLEVLKVERFTEADLQYALNDRNSGVASM